MFLMNKTKKSWMYFGVYCALTMMSPDVSARIFVANYRADFKVDAPLASGWQYLWNAPSDWVENASSGDLRSGFVGVPGEYVPLQDAGDVWTPDGDAVGSNNFPAGFLKLSATGGHPGKHTDLSNLRDRYAIAAFSVPFEGNYAIENSFLTKGASSGDAVEVLVFPGASSPILQREAAPASTIDFNVQIGFLEAGKTIYVAFGPGESGSSDAFLTDFDIVHYPGTNIQAQINAAVNLGQTNVVIAPGRYYSDKNGRHVDLNNVSNLSIQAEGVSLICQTPNRGLELENCHDIQVQGLSIDYDPVLYAQGTIEDIGSDWLDLRIHEGYPVPTAAKGSSMVYEPSGDNPLKQGAGQRYPRTDGTAFQQVEPDLIRYAFTQHVTDSTVVGDYFTMVQDTGVQHGIGILDSTEVRLDEVTVMGAPAFGIIAVGGGDMIFNKVDVIPGDKPLLASVKRLRSSNADGIHVRSTDGHIRMTDCRCEYTGDDSLVLTSFYAPIVDVPAENTVRLVSKDMDNWKPGDELELYEHASMQQVVRSMVSATKAPLTESQVKALTDQYFPQWRYADDTAYDVVLDSPVNALPGDLVSNRNLSNEEFLIADCSVKNTRARGILVKAGNGMISNCVVETTWLAGLQMRPEAMTFMEGDYAHDVQVVGNRLNNCGIISLAKGSIRLDAADAYGWSAFGHTGILFEDNVISNAPGASIYMQYAADIEFRDNRFCRSHDWMVSPDLWNESVIWLDTVDQIRFTGTNWVCGLGAGADREKLIGCGSAMGSVSGRLHRPLNELVIERNPAYLNWKNKYALLEGADGNDDADAMTNFEEFALGGNPTNSNDAGYPPLLETQGGAIRFIHVQRKDSYLGYSLELTDDLMTGIWTNAGYVAWSTNAVDAEFDVVTNQVALSGDTKQFMRLKFNQR